MPKRRSTKKTKMRNSAIPKSKVAKSTMTIHQIFYNIGRGELKDIPAFKKCYDHNKQYCKKH